MGDIDLGYKGTSSYEKKREELIRRQEKAKASAEKELNEKGALRFKQGATREYGQVLVLEENRALESFCRYGRMYNKSSLDDVKKLLGYQSKSISSTYTGYEFYSVDETSTVKSGYTAREGYNGDIDISPNYSDVTSKHMYAKQVVKKVSKTIYVKAAKEGVEELENDFLKEHDKYLSVVKKKPSVAKARINFSISMFLCAVFALLAIASLILSYYVPGGETIFSNFERSDWHADSRVRIFFETLVPNERITLIAKNATKGLIIAGVLGIIVACFASFNRVYTSRVNARWLRCLRLVGIIIIPIVYGLIAIESLLLYLGSNGTILSIVNGLLEIVKPALIGLFALYFLLSILGILFGGYGTFGSIKYDVKEYLLLLDKAKKDGLIEKGEKQIEEILNGSFNIETGAPVKKKR